MNERVIHLSFKTGKFVIFILFAVSFFGASHINMPLQEAKLSTNIRLKFRTRQPSAMIFLTSGRTDHCLLTLNDGRIKFQLKINEYETEVRRSETTIDVTVSISIFSISLAKKTHLYDMYFHFLFLLSLSFYHRSHSSGRHDNIHLTISFGMRS